MARQTYGNTWWGAQWLDALTHIDYDNRLPRGRNYANKGAVQKLSINNGVIKAKVSGSRATPYQVSIQVPAMAARNQTRLLKHIAQDSVLIAHLLNGELDPALLKLATKLRIKIFPKRWQDLDMSCSCPDWAVPCKHLAAVIYLLSREIDANPFLVFSLRDFDLIEALKKQDIHIEKEANNSLPTVDELMGLDHRTSLEASTTSTQEATLATLDLTALPSLLSPLIHLLPTQPIFFPLGDFKSHYERLLKRIAKQAQKIIDHQVLEDTDSTPSLICSDDRPKLLLDKNYSFKLSGMNDINDCSELINTLSTLPPQRLPKLQNEVAALYQVRLIALHMLAAGAVTAQLYTRAAKTEEPLGLRWIPAKLSETINTWLQAMANQLPPQLLQYRKGNRHTLLPATTQAEALCSLFLNHYVFEFCQIGTLKLFENKSASLFFNTGRARFDDTGENGMASAIQNWLQRHHLIERSRALILRLDDSSRHSFALSFAADTLPSGQKNTNSEPTPLAKVLASKAWSNTRFKLLQTLALISEYIPQVNTHINNNATAPISIPTDELPQFIQDTLPLIRLLGLRTLIPKALEQLLRPRLSLQIRGTNKGSSSGLLQSDQLFSFDWKIALGKHLITRAQFEKLVKNATGVIRFKGEYVYLEANEIERLQKQLQQAPDLQHNALLKVALANEYHGATIALDARAQRIIQQLRKTENIALPKQLKAKLRSYQETGYAWLYRNARSGFGSVIADDMGLGKTLQVITTMQKLKEEGAFNNARALVVVPTTLLSNWQKEITRFAPELSVELYHGNQRKLSKQRPDILLTSYGVVRRDTAKLKKLQWLMVVVDEAQNIKNPQTIQTKAIKQIPAQHYIAMSGTPVENSLIEYWSIMNFANPGYLGKLSEFTREYAVPIQSHRDLQAIERFKQVTAPFILRRLKSDKSIISDLPDKIEQNQFCTLSPTQIALYESVVREAMQVIQGESNSFKRQGLVLQMILALKQICNHPAQYLKQEDTEADLSGKAERFLELLSNILANNEKVLVFTQFKAMGNLLKQWTQGHYNQEALFLHGGTARNRRDKMVEQFQQDHTQQVFILSLKAGGTGLNLTAASHVIHYDLWWNPAVEAQATDRAYRIGQNKNVQVHRFITRNTFEERIDDLIQSKRKLANLTVTTGEKWIGDLSDEEIKNLFTLGAK